MKYTYRLKYVPFRPDTYLYTQIFAFKLKFNPYTILKPIIDTIIITPRAFLMFLFSVNHVVDLFTTHIANVAPRDESAWNRIPYRTRGRLIGCTGGSIWESTRANGLNMLCRGNRFKFDASLGINPVTIRTPLRGRMRIVINKTVAN